MVTLGEGWQFWVDRGGTFTDVVARHPDGSLSTRKLLSDNPRHYEDAAVAAVHDLIGTPRDGPLPAGMIDAVKMGTTVATNALLERTGEPTVYVTTRGFADALRIGDQTRPDIFALDIDAPEMLYDHVIEVDERHTADGAVVRTLDVDAVRQSLVACRDNGVDSVAVNLLHGYRHSTHEKQVANIAHGLGFGQVSVGHEVSPLMRLVPRGDTTVVDAYLSPVLRRYTQRLERLLRPEGSGPRLLFMQSNGGLADAAAFRGKDALLSGPAGGVIGMIATGRSAGFERLIGFDMGGTSTDVSHYAGDIERVSERNIAGVRVRAPSIDIHTVAAGGGSIVWFDGSRMRVGPESAGADPGPACYRRGGPPTITDCNVVLGKLRPEHFPSAFGADGSGPISESASRDALGALAGAISEATGVDHDAVDVANGFLVIAVENMANAIKKISIQRGHDISDHTLSCFGGAGGQHACLVADRLEMSRIHVPRHAGVLSALGVGLAEVRHVLDRAIELTLDTEEPDVLSSDWSSLESACRHALREQGVADGRILITRRMSIRYAGSDSALLVDAETARAATTSFEEAHRARFGFASPGRDVVVESIQVEAVGEALPVVHDVVAPAAGGSELGSHPTVMAGERRPTPFHQRSLLTSGVTLDGPAVVVDVNATTVVEPGWRAHVTDAADLVIERVATRSDAMPVGVESDPMRLEVFNNLFMNIAEQMGVVLESTAHSVNIRERRDFSCALFDPTGDLIANAPHIPVHLGSMGDAVSSIIAENPDMGADQVFVSNAPYKGGTHLPDVTVVAPVAAGGGAGPDFFVAARGHHADIGGITPGSAPADSTSIEQEGILLDNVLLVSEGRFHEAELRRLLASGPYPARAPDQNIADLEAQVAACRAGAAALAGVVDRHGLDVVHAYMGHVKRNAEEAVREVIDTMTDGAFTCETDDGHRVSVAISVDHPRRAATIDFTGTSAVHPGNFNAPSAVARAAVLYVFRCLVDDDIPLNAGCMIPLDIIVPSTTMVSPRHPAAVVAGNVETSQLIVDALLGAIGGVAASQGTMNNVSWGNDRHQYYETICGGAGATPNADGCDAVHTHMTNSRLTDPEVLESRYPVVIESFRVRRGSGGAGVRRGGDGVVRRIRFDEPMTLNIVSSRRRVRPYGIEGGRPGLAGHNRIIRADGTPIELPGTARVEMGAGDRVEIETPGGGGCGFP